ncbi:hypothetical protein Lal_00041725, partial [Lupinus albus]
SGIASSWCKDIGKVGSPDADTSGWFDGNVCKEIGNGLQTLFWHDIWVGNQSLRMVFLRLFRLAINQNSWVGDNGFWRDVVWIWKILWRRNLFGRNESLAQNLDDLIHRHSCKRDILDSWRWSLDGSGDYVVRTSYLAQLNHQQPPLVSISNSVLDSLKLHESIRSVGCAKLWRMLWFMVIWSVWIMRNDVIFSEKAPSYVHLLDLIKTRSWIWLSSF